MSASSNSTPDVSGIETTLLVPNLSTCVICFTIFLIAFIYHLQGLSNNKHSLRGLPPAIPSIPFLGSLPFLGLDPRKPLLKMREKYGDIFTVYLGKRPVIILSSYGIIKEAFVRNSDAFSGRPQNNFFVKYVSRGYGLLSTQGKVGQEQRKFAHRVLRDLGMGHPEMEKCIQDELKYFTSSLSKITKESQAFDPSDLIEAAVSNITCKLVLGRRYEYDDPEFINYLHLLNDNFKVTGNSGPLNLFPLLRHIPGDPFHFHHILRTVGQMKAFFRSHINSHRRTFNPTVTRDFIDAYIKEIQRQQSIGNFDSSFHDDQLEFVIADLFAAGTETVTTSLLWVIILMLHNPEVQTQVQNEILNAISPDTQPSMQHRGLLPYTWATMLEVQRVADIVPLAAPHKTLEPVTLRGYNIPKGTIALPHLHAVHRDPQLWKDPDTFDPSRFLDAEGRVQKSEYLIPFSMGKRACLGGSIGRMELFLFFAAMMQKVSFKSPPGCPLPRRSGTLGVTNTPDQFDIICQPPTH